MEISMKKICQCCQIEFIANGEYSKRHRKYCSLECYKKSISTTIEIACQMCGESFVVRGKYKNRKFCSTSCYRQNKKNSSKTILMKCVNCDNYTSRYKYQQEIRNMVFCGRKCMQEYAHSKCTDHQDYFRDIDTKEKAYALGLIASDGCVSGINRINLTMNDFDAIEFFAKQVGYNNKISCVTGKKSNHADSYSLTISSDIMRKDLESLNILPRKSSMKDLSVPTVLENLERFFWAGFIDGDGSVNIKKHKYGNYVRISVVSASEKYIERLSIFLLKNAISSSVTKYRNIYSISFGGKRTAQQIYDLFYSDEFGMERKRCKLKKYVEGIQSTMI